MQRRASACARDLVAEQIECLGRRADEGDLFLGAAACERGVFAQEAVARMHRVASGRHRRRDHGLDVEIGPRPASGNGMRFIRRTDMQRQRVVRWVDRDRGDAGVRRGASDANGDFAAIGDQEFTK